MLAELNDSGDTDTAPPAISTGIYFGLGSGVTAPTETAVDGFVLNTLRVRLRAERGVRDAHPVMWVHLAPRPEVSRSGRERGGDA